MALQTARDAGLEGLGLRLREYLEWTADITLESFKGQVDLGLVTGL